MGKTAERIHDRFPHAHQGALRPLRACVSQQKLAAAYAAGNIQPDLVPVAAPQRAGWGLATADEAPAPETTMEGLATLKTPFRPHGRVTAGNAPAQRRRDRVAPRLRPPRRRSSASRTKMRLVSFAFAGVEPEIMGIGPVPSTEKALRKAGLIDRPTSACSS